MARGTAARGVPWYAVLFLPRNSSQHDSSWGGNDGFTAQDGAATRKVGSSTKHVLSGKTSTSSDMFGSLGVPRTTSRVTCHRLVVGSSAVASRAKRSASDGGGRTRHTMRNSTAPSTTPNPTEMNERARWPTVGAALHPPPSRSPPARGSRWPRSPAPHYSAAREPRTRWLRCGLRHRVGTSEARSPASSMAPILPPTTDTVARLLCVAVSGTASTFTDT
jgi:hypothetical protein